ncbi:MAG: hypothetical protein ACRDOG_03060 [Gaiellaceae bacterium]
MFFLVDDHGKPLDTFRTRDEAVAALESLIADEPRAADECAVLELDATGARVGEPITLQHA